MSGRLPGADPQAVEPPLRAVLDAQTERYGAPLALVNRRVALVDRCAF